LQFLNDRIKSFQYDKKCKDKPLALDYTALERGSTLGQTVASMKNLMILLPFLVGDAVPAGDENWLNYLRLLQITILSVSVVVSQRTVSSLEQLIASHNFKYCELYPDEPFTPKFHYMVHFPQQILQYGPMRHHCCFRYEAKNGFFKQKRWFNFMNISKSLAFHHQRWMCVSMLDVVGSQSETYLYAGDEVQEGSLVDFESVKDYLPESVAGKNVLLTHRICTQGLTYDVSSVLLMNFDESPQFVEIREIYVVENMKFLQCLKLSVTTFVSHKNAFRVEPTAELVAVNASELKYGWPQIVQEDECGMLVMLYNCDEVWML